MENQLICICGPTASGKSALAAALAKARQTEIISADSMQLYRGMDIGTAKPTEAERMEVPHHLLDIREPGEPFSVAQFVALADACAQSLLAQGKIPVVAGGTGLYMDALIECNTFSGGDTDPAIREHYQQMAASQGNEAVHDALRAVDPESAERLHPNNLKRVIRALEVFHTTGMTIGVLNARSRRAEPKYRAYKLGLCPASRSVLYERIERRVEQMLCGGLLDEAAALLSTGKLTGTAAQAIGYKELIPFLEGRDSLENCTALLKQHTRNYAKRHLTWLARDPGIHWLRYEEGTEFAALLHDSTAFLHACGV